MTRNSLVKDIHTSQKHAVYIRITNPSPLGLASRKTRVINGKFEVNGGMMSVLRIVSRKVGRVVNLTSIVASAMSVT